MIPIAHFHQIVQRCWGHENTYLPFSFILASEVLGDQLTLRLAEKQERRSDFVMNHWGNRNGQLGELMDLLKRLRLLRPLDVIQSCELTTIKFIDLWQSHILACTYGYCVSADLSSLTPVFSPPPACHQHHLSVAPKTSQATPTVSTCRLRPTGMPISI